MALLHVILSGILLITSYIGDGHCQVRDINIGQDFTNNALLDDKFTLAWQTNDTHIAFKMHVQTSGYIGLGISVNGRMFPSDIMIGGVADGVGYITDRHAIHYTQPIEDTRSDDWELVDSFEANGITHLTVVRALHVDGPEANLPEDISIQRGDTHVIFSYGIDDFIEANPGNVNYHGRRRGSVLLNLLES